MSNLTSQKSKGSAKYGNSSFSNEGGFDSKQKVMLQQCCFDSKQCTILQLCCNTTAIYSVTGINSNSQNLLEIQNTR